MNKEDIARAFHVIGSANPAPSASKNALYEGVYRWVQREVKEGNFRSVDPALSDLANDPEIPRALITLRNYYNCGALLVEKRMGHHNVNASALMCYVKLAGGQPQAASLQAMQRLMEGAGAPELRRILSYGARSAETRAKGRMARYAHRGKLEKDGLRLALTEFLDEARKVYNDEVVLTVSDSSGTTLLTIGECNEQPRQPGDPSEGLDHDRIPERQGRSGEAESRDGVETPAHASE